ncbi:MAG TPA: ABC transporter permease [Gemmatimonadales bacterium]
MTSSGPGWYRHPLVQLTLVRYREFFREPEAVFWVFIFPILLTAGLGIAFRRTAPERTPIAVVGSTPGTGELLQALRQDSSLKVQALDDSAATDSVRTGRVALVVRSLGPGMVQYEYDSERPESRTTRLAVDEAVQRAGGQRQAVRVSERKISERGSRYVDFVVPGLLGMNLMGSGIWGLGFAIVDARRKRLLKRLVATPMSRVQYLTSFVLSRLTLLIIEVVLLLGFAVVAFNVPIRGSLLLLVMVCVLSSLAFTALGLLIASRAKTVEGVSGLMNLVMLPMWIFSGVFFSASRFPDAIQPLIQVLPLTAVVDALRATMLQGVGPGRLLPELAIISGWLAVSFLLSLKLFRWR